MAVTVWVKAAPKFRLEDGAVVVTILTGNEEHDLIISRANFRKALETGKRMLDAAELAERDCVSVFERGGG